MNVHGNLSGLMKGLRDEDAQNRDSFTMREDQLWQGDWLLSCRRVCPSSRNATHGKRTAKRSSSLASAERQISLKSEYPAQVELRLLSDLWL